MTNAEAAAHFASLPPGEPAQLLLINEDTCSAMTLEIDEPCTNFENVKPDFLDEVLDDGDEKLVTAFQKW